MTVKEYKEKLQHLHDVIKNNPFRKDYETHIKYGKGYYDVLYSFAETFYHLTDDIRKDRLKDVSENDRPLTNVANDCLFIHDFYGSINRSLNAILSHEGSNDPKIIDILHNEEELIELYLSCIHCYLDTGYFNRYPFKYRGAIKWAEWNYDRKEYIIDIK
jgi:hypothetical protein